MRVLITAGPTREYLDDVRFLSNASSGQMGYAIADECVKAGHEVILISGPVALTAPAGCTLIPVETTSDLAEACQREFANCDGVIAVAAVCDYRPKERAAGKLKKTGGSVVFEMVETTDVLATLGQQKKSHQWLLGFALESQNPRDNAIRKLQEKRCDFIVLNDTTAIGSTTNAVEVIGQDGQTSLKASGTKQEIATRLVKWIDDNLNSSK